MFFSVLFCSVCGFASGIPGQKLMLFGGGHGMERFGNPKSNQPISILVLEVSIVYLQTNWLENC